MSTLTKQIESAGWIKDNYRHSMIAERKMPKSANADEVLSSKEKLVQRQRG